MRVSIKTSAAAAVLAMTLAAGTAANCFAGAWTLPEGKMYDKFSLNYFKADDRFTDTNLGNYIEYGLTDTVSIINAVYVKQIKNEYYSTGVNANVKTTSSGVGDIELGLKHKLADGRYGVLSHQALLKVPGPYGKQSALPLGNGQFDAEYRVLYGVSLWFLFPGYANLEAGYRWRAEAPADEFRYLVEIGTNITSRLYARVKLDGIVSRNNADAMADQSGNPTTYYQYDLQKLDTALGYKLTDTWGLEIGYTPALSARNTVKGTTYSMGITYLMR